MEIPIRGSRSNGTRNVAPSEEVVFTESPSSTF